MSQKPNPFDDDNFAKHCNIELIELLENGARAKMTLDDFHLNGAGVVHGGSIFTLAAWTFAYAANSLGSMAMGLNANISFISAAKTGTLYAHATEISVRETIANYNVEVTDDNGQLIATLQGTAYRQKKRKKKS